VSAEDWWIFASEFFWNDPAILLYLLGIPFLYYYRRRSPRAAMLGITALAAMFVFNVGFTLFELFFYASYGDTWFGIDTSVVTGSQDFPHWYQLGVAKLVNKLLLGVLVVAVLIDRTKHTTNDT
jgi:hypothetical protein